LKLVLVQPRLEQGPQPYLPKGLLMVAAQLLEAGLPMPTIVDENLGHELRHESTGSLVSAQAVGIGCLGPPYVPEALRVGRWLRDLGFSRTILIGGEMIKRLQPEQFDRIFGSLGDVRQICSDHDLEVAVDRQLPHHDDVSVGPAIERLPPQMQKAYFSKEFCIYTSQGCIYNCRFCAASRGQKEQFHNVYAFRSGMKVIAKLVREHAGSRPQFEAYLSTLDGCQNPKEMDERLSVIAEECRNAGVFLPLRFLATAKCTVKATNKDPYLLRRWRGYGVSCIGIGVDGPVSKDNGVWTREHKEHNTEDNVRSALRRIAEAGIQPEGLMVMGLPEDTVEDIIREALACFQFARQGIRSRPYLGKAHAPGSGGWNDDAATVERFLENPELFRELDYGGLGSPTTHPNARNRRVGNAAFFLTSMALKLTKLGCPTQPLLPTASGPLALRIFGRVWNSLMPQDR
jgi:hypothetical protein